MGAIEKPDGSVRPLHDGTHFVQVNNHIKFQDQLQYPGPHDAAALLRETCETRDSYFVLGAGISAAHRLVKVRKSDWHLLCCKARSESATTWVNCVGTFGISSAAYWVDAFVWMCWQIHYSSDAANLADTTRLCRRPSIGRHRPRKVPSSLDGGRCL